jgi:hypothetical protein
MGANLTKLSTADDVKAELEELGAAYKPYAEAATANGIGGEILYAITEAGLKFSCGSKGIRPSLKVRTFQDSVCPELCVRCGCSPVAV